MYNTQEMGVLLWNAVMEHLFFLLAGSSDDNVEAGGGVWDE